MCFVQFAVINFIGIFIGRYKKRETEQKELEDQRKEQKVKPVPKDSQPKEVGKKAVVEFPEEQIEIKVIPAARVPMASIEASYIATDSSSSYTSEDSSPSEHIENVLFTGEYKINFLECETKEKKRKKWRQKLVLFFELQLTKVVSLVQIRPLNQMMVYQDTDQFLELIDEYSRIFFPGTFMVMMLIYWTTYLYVMGDDVVQISF